ncbi:MAG: 4-hydroxy-tetrahydrodipicolinate reductase [Actinobacteria bacterium]|nr:MAG: 4-hydroxy-tetrahydrodipicolinate reductase [Actinomycetota bacterium]RIK08488.1 MAG: 4-hydroxy-tetrahydrodipicolinate reductase [Acidobacteriota bacterium]
MSLRVGVFGAGGRMGSTVCQAVDADPALELVAAVDPHHAGLDLHSVAHVEGYGIQVAGDPEVFVDAAVEVAVDFTLAEAARENLLWLARQRIHAVTGTTGFSEQDYADFERAFTDSNCVIAPNFAIGAVLMMRFAEIAAPFFETAEVVEYHHDQKVDAPSGTAMMTARKIAEASKDWAADPTEHEVAEGARGGVADGIRVHAVRMRGMVAHQEVVMGTTGQTLTLRHDSYDRTSFMPGVLLAVKAVSQRSGLTVGLDRLLEI